MVDRKESPSIVPLKSYERPEWLHSRSARPVRIMCEYLEVQDRLQSHRVLASLVIFGSARALSHDQWKERNEAAKIRRSEARTEEEVQNADAELLRLQRVRWMCDYWDKLRNLCKRMMVWFQTAEARKAIGKYLTEIPPVAGGAVEDYAKVDLQSVSDTTGPSPVAICTGGGPGFMEAANKGASEVNKCRSLGMGITLPFEAELNPYVHPELSFQFHYFFTRKFWMVYTALGVVSAPGGLGTLDELFEVLTLKQTLKLKRDIPVVLFGKKFWEDIINFEKLIEYGTIKMKDKEQLFFTDSEDEAFEYLKNHILSDKLILGSSYVHKSVKRIKVAA